MSAVHSSSGIAGSAFRADGLSVGELLPLVAKPRLHRALRDELGEPAQAVVGAFDRLIQARRQRDEIALRLKGQPEPALFFARGDELRIVASRARFLPQRARGAWPLFH